MRISRALIKATFGHRDYRLLWGDAVFNSVGMAGEVVILGLLAFQATGSSAWVGIALAVYYVPALFVGALAGAIADWMDRRRLIRRCVLASMITLTIYAIVLANGVLEVGQLLVMAVVAGSARAVYQPGRLSYAYDLVGPDLALGGLGVLSLGIRIGQLAGSLLAGFVMQRFGAHWAYLALVFTYGIGYLMLLNLETAGVAGGIDRTPFRQNLSDYWRELCSNRALSTLCIVMVGVGICGFSYVTVLPELATNDLGVDAEGLGLMHAARALGGIVGVFALTAAGLFRNQGRFLMFTLFAFGLTVLLVGFAPTFTLAIAALILLAAVGAVYDVLTQSVMQRIVANHLRGRAMGTWVFVIGIEPLGHVQIGVLAAVVGVALALQINGGLLLLIVLAALLAAPRLRQL